MQTTTRSSTAGALALVLGLVFSMLALAASPAFAATAPDLTIVSGPSNGEGNCAESEKHGAWDNNPEYGIDEAWGTFDGSTDSNVATASIKAGWTVSLCIKEANAYRYWTVKCDAAVDCASTDLEGAGNGSSHLAWRDAELTVPDPLTGVQGTFICAAPDDGSFELFVSGSEGFVSQELNAGDYVFRFYNPNSEGVKFSAGTPAGNDNVVEEWMSLGAGDTVFTTVSSAIAGVSTNTTSADETADPVNRGTFSTNEDQICDSTPEPEAPTVVLSTDCEGTQPTATVTIDNDGDDEFSVEVFIDGISQGTITETTSYDGDAESVLRVEWGEDASDDVTFENCTEDEPLLSTASFTVDSECEENLPALTYAAMISETADDPVGDVTLTVVDANGVERAQATVAENAADSIQLPVELEGTTVTVSWDFDDATAEQTLAEGCAAVLGVVQERDPAPAPAAQEKTDGAPVVASEQLPNAGFEEDLLLLLGGAFLALGCSVLLYGRRRYGVTA